MNVCRSIRGRAGNERGIALVTAMLVTLLMSALMIGFTAVVMSDQRYRYYDRDRVRAFYGAHSGLEKLNAELANLFFVRVAPTAAEITALGANPPAIPNVTFVTEGTGAYGVTAVPPPPGSNGWNPISTGPYQGLIALKQAYAIDSNVRTDGGGEAHLRRTLETVSIPVFQFGMFSDVDLSFHAGPNFNFGGRVHTNGNLFLAQGNGTTLTLPQKVTAFQEVIRQKLANGVAIGTSGHTGTVRIATAPGVFRNLATTEGSVVDSVGSALNDPTWTNVSLSAYNGYIRNGRTGARVLNLPIVTMGGTNPGLMMRPAPNEDATNPTLYGERYFGKVSLRILLSDTAADITSLPTVTATPPVQLDGDWAAAPPNNGVGYGPVSPTNPPIARSPGVITATTAGGSAGATINVVTSQPFQPTIFVGGAQVTGGCTGKDATNFTGCAGTPAAAAGAVVTARSGLTTTTTAAIAAGAATIPVVSTTSFVPSPFWVGTNLVTCTDWTATSFKNCAGSAAPGAGVVLTTNALSQANTGVVGGFLKIERQDPNHGWTDVTMEILNYGIGAPNLGGTICADPTPNAIIRIQRLRDNVSSGANGGGCNYAGSTSSYDYWPNVLFDPREALFRDVSPGATNLLLGGVIHYLTIDVANLSRWFNGAAPYGGGTGANSLTDNGGFSVYFSDRRNNRNLVGQETGQYGFEDIVNPASDTGAPDGSLNGGEDVDANGLLDTYGQFPNYNGVPNTAPPGALAPLDVTARPTTAVSPPQARVNRAVLFRRALKLINGSLGNIVMPGLTIASENPVYVHGDWNANQAGFGTPNAATSILTDAVTLLSNNWNDSISFTSPYTPGGRARSAQSFYRFGVIAGKNMAFNRPTVGGVPQDFGTDGGAHNFLRMLESGGTVNYLGSIATFYYSRQAVGVYKCCATVYGAPTRNYNFDAAFLNPATLPPLTPMFRDLNSLGFTQEIRPGF